MLTPTGWSWQHVPVKRCHLLLPPAEECWMRRTGVDVTSSSSFLPVQTWRKHSEVLTLWPFLEWSHKVSSTTFFPLFLPALFHFEIIIKKKYELDSTLICFSEAENLRVGKTAQTHRRQSFTDAGQHSWAAHTRAHEHRKEFSQSCLWCWHKPVVQSEISWREVRASGQRWVGSRIFSVLTLLLFCLVLSLSLQSESVLYISITCSGRMRFYLSLS